MPTGIYNGDVLLDIEKPEEDETVACDGCPGNGLYYGRGYVENGVFKGFTGTCFRCQGKGRMTPADVRRCQHYDNHVRRFPSF